MASTAISAQGTIFQIGTGTGGAKTISGAPGIGFPTTLTATAHALNAGDRVTIASIVGTLSALNGQTFSITHKTTNTITIAYDSTGLAYTSGGTATPVTYTAVANVKSANGFDGAASELDTTNLASTAKEKKLGLVDNGGLSLELHQDNSDAGQVALRAKQVSGVITDFKLILPSGSLPTASFQGFVKKMSTNTGVDALVTTAIDITISGPVTWA